MPALESGVYCNWGAGGPSPRRVVEAAEAALEHHEYEAPTAEGMYPATFDVYDEARTAVGGLLGATPDEIALTESTTDGINRVAGAFDWDADDVVVRTDLEHSAGILPWQRLERQEGLEVRVLETSVASETQRADGDRAEQSSADHSSGQRPREEAVDEGGRLDLEAVKAAAEDATLFCVSSLTWTHGTRLPVAEIVDIARDAGALTLIDAVQSPGQVPVDVREWGADFVVGAGHKWLLGPFGAGFLYVRDGVEDGLSPAAIGYRSVEEENADDYRYAPGARRFEVGTASPAPYAGLTEAIDLLEAIGIDAIQRRIETLTDRLKDGVPDDRLVSPREYESGLVTIDADDPAATVDRLADRGIVVRPLPTPDAIRASIHAFNSEADVDALLEAL
ncbi:class V aminotransferase [Natrinema pellirubrum DSM 15624]|uniref:Class V aminotransferase n=1 Tax=Natrinema pellirubrum (strain DSM 15624 / CIP 106293 / JCM 10476 / NCIMB 786 / 157) TaxID=797303 RepID=L0JGX3_NATP1|nr:aminotransferase class V-fold PLP-dependent enzyme [Natrinema pellirubrum]AGB30564.1 selenocysteine lyase [Natrinema pellirubrum DSM 15624]ELY77033.1 class V aminotransferase [Natrinema pellirubrum DSM 15624]